jgi:RNA polymerase sigma factor (sigma-70 family)
VAGLGAGPAEDIAAETFAVAFGQRDRFDPQRGSLRPWLFGIATNLIARYRRKEARHYRALARMPDLPSAGSHEDRVVAGVAAWGLQPQLLNALATLSQGERDVVLLVALSQFSHEEVAQALGISAGTVGSRLSRARKRLRHAISQEATMDEMDMLRNVLTKPWPSSDTVSKGRRELQQLIRHQSRARTRRPGWRMAIIGLTASAAAGPVAAAMVLTPGGVPAAPRAHARSAAMGHHPAPAAESVQQILLTAATSAQRAPAGAGTYWYVQTRATWGGNTLTLSESWTKRDGETWIRDQKSGSTPLDVAGNAPGPFFLGGQEMTFRQVEDLLADPAALTKWIVTNAALHGGKSGGPAPSKAREREDIFESLDSLLSQLPSPPHVRAAAFRALAALPGVTSLGLVGGGQGVQFTLLGGEQATLIIDPSTGQIRATNFFVASDGSTYWQPTVNATITGQWTDTLP